MLSDREQVVNQPVQHLNTGKVSNLGSCFNGATSFNQSLAGWTIKSVTNAASFFGAGHGISRANYDATLIGWAAQTPNIPIGLTITFGTSQYTLGGAAEAARNVLIGAPYNWTITDGGGV